MICMAQNGVLSALLFLLEELWNWGLIVLMELWSDGLVTDGRCYWLSSGMIADVTPFVTRTWTARESGCPPEPDGKAVATPLRCQELRQGLRDEAGATIGDGTE